MQALELILDQMSIPYRNVFKAKFRKNVDRNKPKRKSPSPIKHQVILDNQVPLIIEQLYELAESNGSIILAGWDRPMPARFFCNWSFYTVTSRIRANLVYEYIPKKDRKVEFKPLI